MYVKKMYASDCEPNKSRIEFRIMLQTLLTFLLMHTKSLASFPPAYKGSDK